MANDWKNQARGLALLVLENVFEEGAYSNIALNQELKHSDEKDQGISSTFNDFDVTRSVPSCDPGWV